VLVLVDRDGDVGRRSGARDVAVGGRVVGDRGFHGHAGGDRIAELRDLVGEVGGEGVDRGILLLQALKHRHRQDARGEGAERVGAEHTGEAAHDVGGADVQGNEQEAGRHRALVGRDGEEAEGQEADEQNREQGTEGAGEHGRRS
jgi:hypothetical protein